MDNCIRISSRLELQLEQLLGIQFPDGSQIQVGTRASGSLQNHILASIPDCNNRMQTLEILPNGAWSARTWEGRTAIVTESGTLNSGIVARARQLILRNGNQ